ncbi:hypothetical protein [Chitinophaga varians]|uniref:hypothetical protein n=1 Tax=Chitinophaga varians TaxID=2202339 RepID=UPI00165EDA46|nr:hypothetical protein [Chitinophaga varians]MBC9908954.1 hypothetical protein [Chitinophaga varians]
MLNIPHRWLLSNLILLFFLLMVSCSKNNKEVLSSPKDQLLTDAQNWYGATSKATGELNWDKAQVLTDTSISIPAPFKYKLSKGGRSIRKVVITRTKSGFKGYLLVIITTSEYGKQNNMFRAWDFSGVAGRYDLNMHFQYGYYYEQGVPKYKADFESFPSKDSYDKTPQSELECKFLQETYIDSDGVFTVYGYSVCTDRSTGGDVTPPPSPWEGGIGGGSGGGGGTGSGGGGRGNLEEHEELDPPARDPQPLPAATNKNPCDERKTIDSNMKVPAFSKPLSELRGKLATSSNEWGVEQALSTLGGKWVQKPLYTDNNIDHIHSNFTWNAAEGYTIGFAHSHPAGTAPSPQDIFDLVEKALNSPEFKLYPSDLNFFIKNASLTVVTKDNNYIITLNDWDKIKTLYESFKSDPGAFENNFRRKSTELKSATSGLLSIFGSAVNIYLDPLDNMGVIPVELDSNSKLPVGKPC